MSNIKAINITGGRSSRIYDELEHYFGDFECPVIISILIQWHNERVKDPKFNGKIWQSYSNLGKRYRTLTKRKILDRIKKIRSSKLAKITSDPKTNTNIFELNVNAIQRMIDGETYEKVFDLKKDKAEGQSQNVSGGQSQNVSGAVTKCDLVKNSEMNSSSVKNESSLQEDSRSASNRSFKWVKCSDGIRRKKYIDRKNPVQPTSLSSQKDSQSLSTKSNTLSEENKSTAVPKENINGAAPQNNPIPKIKKKSDIDPDLDNMTADGFKKEPPKPKYEYTVKDIQLFNLFVSIGFINHQKGTKIYYQSMDYIHELLGKHRPPYSRCKSVHDSFKSTKPTIDEIEEVAKYYIKNCSQPKREIAYFIYRPGFNGNSDYSPMCEWFSKMEKNSTENLTGKAATLSKWFKEDGMEGSLDAGSYKKIIEYHEEVTKGYYIHRSLSHIYHGDPLYAFFTYVKDKLRVISFQVEFIRGEKFHKEFVSDMIKRGVFVR